MATMGNPRHHRKQVYVSRAIQGRLLARLGGYFIIYHLILWHVLFLTQEFPLGGSGPFVDRYAAFFTDHALLLVCMAAVLPILLWDMLKFSHRIAGPFVRFERALRQMARGESIKPVSLRKGDVVVEFLDAFNDLIATRNRELSDTGGSAAKQRQAAGNDTQTDRSRVNNPQAADSYVQS